MYGGMIRKWEVNWKYLKTEKPDSCAENEIKQSRESTDHDK